MVKIEVKKTLTGVIPSGFFSKIQVEILQKYDKVKV